MKSLIIFLIFCAQHYLLVAQTFPLPRTWYNSSGTIGMTLVNIEVGSRIWPQVIQPANTVLCRVRVTWENALYGLPQYDAEIINLGTVLEGYITYANGDVIYTSYIGSRRIEEADQFDNPLFAPVVYEGGLTNYVSHPTDISTILMRMRISFWSYDENLGVDQILTRTVWEEFVAPEWYLVTLADSGCSVISGIDSPEISRNVTYPNPAQAGENNIRFKGKEGIYKLFDSSGKLREVYEFENDSWFSIREKGAYYLLSEKGEVYNTIIVN